MSYFNEANQADQTPESIENPVEVLVKEKGDKWTDPSVIAKGYLSAQSHIASIERQNAELREDLQKRTTAEEILAQLRESQAKPTSGEPTHDSASTPQETTPSIGVEDIKSLISETISKQESERSTAQNLKEADSKLTELFGTEAGKVADQRAKELGLTKERLMEIAGESPSAFLSLMGQAPAVQGNNVPQSQVNTANDSFNRDPNAKSWEFYQDMRRKNPNQYYSPRVQRQLEADVAAGVVKLP